MVSETTTPAPSNTLRARYYNPATGIFNRLDPFAGNFSDPQSLHKYLYCHADPVNGGDPTGKFAIAVKLAVGVSLGTVRALIDRKGGGAIHDRRASPIFALTGIGASCWAA